jgi:hypothetical protein
MALARYTLLLLIGYTFCSVGVDARASLIVPPLDTSGCFESLKASGAGAATESGANSPDSPPRDTPTQEQYQRIRMSAASPSTGTQRSTGGAGGSSPSTHSPGSDCQLAADASITFHDRCAVTWRCESRWLVVPMPPGVEMLRPPELFGSSA